MRKSDLRMTDPMQNERGEETLILLKPAWVHATVTCYGQWLPGDPRGFRTKRHREHVEGDYKRPPVKDYTGRHRRSRSLLTQTPVRLTPPHRAVALDMIRERVEFLNVTPAAIAVAATHVHIYGRFPAGEPRKLLGRAKRNATERLREIGLGEKVWAKRSRCEVVETRGHARNLYAYILRHAEKEGAALYRWKGKRAAGLA